MSVGHAAADEVDAPDEVEAGPAVDPPDESTWGARHAHDPTAVRAPDGTYYLFSTDALAGGLPRAGVQVRRSTDLVTWDWHGYALDGVPGPAHDWSGAPGLWAPEVVRWGDGYHMYYSASTFGSTRSAIGLAVARDLTGPWEDRGLVVATSPGDGPNAIDANVVRDEQDRPWMVYGSFFDGIRVLALDETTGLAASPGDLGVCIARRGVEVDRAVEGAYVVRRGPRDYVMVLSYDSLFSTYNLRVGRSETVTGPYLDRAGRALTDIDAPPHSVGTKLLGSHRLLDGPVWLAPGHASILTDGPDSFLVHHVRRGEDPTQHLVQVRRLLWTPDGWPVVSPQPFHGEPVGVPTLDALAGRWQVLRFTEGTDVVEPVELELRPEDLSTGEPVPQGLSFRWRTADGTEVTAVAFESWDHGRGAPELSFSGLGSGGHAIMGTRRSGIST